MEDLGLRFAMLRCAGSPVCGAERPGVLKDHDVHRRQFVTATATTSETHELDGIPEVIGSSTPNGKKAQGTRLSGASILGVTVPLPECRLPIHYWPLD